MQPFSLSLKSWILRFYLMMFVILLGGFTGMWWLALLGVPIFASALMGVALSKKSETSKEKIITLPSNDKRARKAV